MSPQGSIPSTLVILCLIIISHQQNRICSVRCREGQCTDQDFLKCTSCNDQYILIDSKCVPVSGQPNPIKFFDTPSQLQIQTPPGFQRNLSEVTCQLGLPQTSKMIFFNETSTTAAVYFTQAYQIDFRSSHQFIQIKMNAILFNRKDNPTIQLLVINRQDKDIFRDEISANVLNQSQGVSCAEDPSQTSVPASYPFYIDLKLSTTTTRIFVQIFVKQVGDQLGISTFEVYYGNCHQSCATCIGSGSNQCLTCKNLLKYNNTENSCSSCPTGMYRLGDSCDICPYNCQQCEYSASKGQPICKSCLALLRAQAPECKTDNQIIESLVSSKLTDSNGWTSDEVIGDIVTICGRYSMVGGLPLGLGNSKISKRFQNLKVHDSVWVKFSLFTIDQEPGSQYKGKIMIGNQERQFELLIESREQNNSECGVDLIEFVNASVIFDNISHNQSFIDISITGFNNYFGIRNFVLGVRNKTNVDNCVAVDPDPEGDSSCIQCKNGYTLTNNSCKSCPQENYYEKDGVCQICPIFCKECQIGDQLNTTVCKSCNSPLSLNQQKGRCVDEGNELYTFAISAVNPIYSLKGWSLYPKLETKGIDKCRDFIIGSSQIKYRRIELTKEFQYLPEHSGVIIYFRFYQIDDYGTSEDLKDVTVYFKIDNQIFPYTVSKEGKQICGNQTLDHLKTVVIEDTGHTSNSLKFSVHGNRVKFGINNIVVFLKNCPECIKNNTIEYELQAIPEYFIREDENFAQDRMKYKLPFNSEINHISNDTNELFSFDISGEIPNNSIQLRQGTGLVDQSSSLRDSFIKKSRELIGYQYFFRDRKNSVANVLLSTPDALFGITESGTIRPIKLSQTSKELPRFDYINLENDQAHIRNLRNFFRGVAVLGMWIGLVSFLFGVSSVFDDLFLLTQLIFVHIFIQSQWLAATFKVPLAGMKFVQFMEWLPDEAKKGIQQGIIPSNHYQRSPIIYEQYFKDITFARTIYHTILFILIIFAIYFLIRLVKAFSRPRIGQVLQAGNKVRGSKRHILTNFYFEMENYPISSIEKGVRFCWFTVIWASILQFTWFENLPFSFFQWNSAVCIILFVLFVLYPFLAFVYLWKKSNTMSVSTFTNLYWSIRIRSKRLWYLPFKYIKLLIIALLIGLLYKANPLAILIPLMLIHLADALIIFLMKPFHLSENKERVFTIFSKHYWTYYRWSHIIQNILFFILELILVIMYARRTLDSRENYFSIGYAASAFVILLLINGLVRVGWSLIRYLEICYDAFQQEMVRISSEDNEDIPINEIRNVPTQVNTNRQLTERNDERKPSIEHKIMPHTLRDPQNI